jgi:anthranilate phosphoribosyltransferase
MKAAIFSLQQGEALPASVLETVFTDMLEGKCGEEEMAAFLLALKERGETTEDIATAARVMRAQMRRFDADVDAMDVCGTGGDGLHTYNISTATAFVLAACGATVIKHGNRSVSSSSGSTDVLSALGVGITDDEAVLKRCLDEANLCFLAAPHFHPAMKHVAPVRQKLKTRTIFNLLGPLCNPAGVRKQLLGVFDAQWLMPMAETLKALGTTSAWVAHGEDGMDEMSITGKTQAVLLDESTLHEATFRPEDAGLQAAELSAIRGGDATHNAQALHSMLDGHLHAYRDAVILNAAAGLCVYGMADDLATGAALADEALKSGRARATLESLVKITGA